MSIGAKLRRDYAGDKIAWIPQPKEDIMFVESENLTPPPEIHVEHIPWILPGKPKKTSPPVDAMKVDMCKPKSMGQTLCVKRLLSTQKITVTTKDAKIPTGAKQRRTSPGHLMEGRWAPTQGPPGGEPLLVSYEYNVTQLMVKVTSCQAKDLELQCVNTTTTDATHKPRRETPQFRALVADASALRRTVVPKLTCETHTLSEIVTVSPCYDGGWNEATGTHQDPIVGMLDSEIVPMLALLNF